MILTLTFDFIEMNTPTPSMISAIIPDTGLCLCFTNFVYCSWGILLLLLDNVDAMALIPDPCLRRVRDSRPLFTPCPGEDLTVSLFWHLIQIDGVFGMFRQM